MYVSLKNFDVNNQIQVCRDGNEYYQDNRSNKAVEIDNAYVMIYYHQQ